MHSTVIVMLRLYSTEAHAVQHAEPNKIHDLLQDIVTMSSWLSDYKLQGLIANGI